MAGPGPRALQGRCLSWNLWCLSEGISAPTVAITSTSDDIRCFALCVLFLLWCLLFSGVGTAPVAGLKARLWPWTDSRGWQALPSHTWPHLLPGGTTQAPHPGAPFWCCLWAVAWWCQGVVVPLPGPVPSQSCLRAKQSEEHWAVPYINFQACLSGKFCSVLFCSFGVFFFAGLLVCKSSEEAAQVEVLHRPRWLAALLCPPGLPCMLTGYFINLPSWGHMV